jgi:hypothetical protein
MKAFFMFLLMSLIGFGSTVTTDAHPATVSTEVKIECVIPAFDFEFSGVTYLPWDVAPLAPDTVGSVETLDGFMLVEEKPPIRFGHGITE